MTSTKQANKLYFVIGAILVAGTLGSFLRPASASNGLQCIDNTKGIDATSTDVNPGDSIACQGASDNPGSSMVKVQVFDGSGAVVQTIGPEAYSVNAIINENFVPNALSSNTGAWSVLYTFYNSFGGQIGRETANFEVSFFVLPESPIGVAAIMGSSLAALGAFVGLRRLKA